MGNLPCNPEPLPNLSETVHHQLTSYALVAGAAGVSLLALVHPAEAEIVYTPTNVQIVQNGGVISLDLNNDGIADFGLSNKYHVGTSQGSAFLNVRQGQPSNEIFQVESQGRVCANALPSGMKVGPGGNFQKDPADGLAMAFANFEGTTYGPWRKVRQAYLGLKFVINGEVHFGWARIKLSSTGRLAINATLTGYAYETTPNKAIIAGKTSGPDGNTVGEPAPAALRVPTPQPAALGVLALGACGASLWRREESVGATFEGN
jgi:hypothetical protein